MAERFERESLVEDDVPTPRDEPASSSQESKTTAQKGVALGKHSIYSHVPNYPKCEIRMRTEITRAPCGKLTGHAIPRAEKFGDLVTADHKVLREGCESRHNHRYAIVVQGLAT